MEAALDAGADDVQSAAGRSVVLCAPDALDAVTSALAKAGFVATHADIVMRPANRVAVTPDAEETLHELIDWLEELDDVQDVYHNAAIAPR